ncbi:UDP-N-acetylglucosamine--N-acetylmuramyl-(pentapeptide) pyrophosphoryl-undecaprenol N-acetylglucosamine transferase [Nonomuraea roseola]|uniref:UDP-N-acetylglucosamine--N-acetylmuramyl-(pentapeptide) pyrophosphoryl-undecaprenol N-acetylglucosamine transferase n=1 Tax=Nonomuraea roseola TaxID=46179 RepID=A0ABV5Q885_9ACTN
MLLQEDLQSTSAHTRPSILIGAGGTGGHIYPGLALAAAILRARPGARIDFVGTIRGLEGRLITGYPLHTVDMVPMIRSQALRFPLALARASLQCRALIRRVGAGVVVGMGGYSSAPLIAGARLAGVPALVHESNAVPGRSNRFSAALTSHVALAMPSDGLAGRVVGMPLMPGLLGGSRAEARQAYGVAEGTRLIIVNGGSAGAVRLNAAAVELAGRWRDRRDVRLVIKAGAEGADVLNDRLAALGAAHLATAVPYLDRMDLVYAAADAMVCRSGSSTVAELDVCGVPAVLVPYPHAPHDHQTRNAMTLKDAVVLPDHELSGAALERALSSLSARSAGGHSPHLDAADRLAAWTLELIK